jgi:hypothetical protein
VAEAELAPSTLRRLGLATAIKAREHGLPQLPGPVLVGIGQRGSLGRPFDPQMAELALADLCSHLIDGVPLALPCGSSTSINDVP